MRIEAGCPLTGFVGVEFPNAFLVILHFVSKQPGRHRGAIDVGGDGLIFLNGKSARTGVSLTYRATEDT
jgi:hypothetical protein